MSSGDFDQSINVNCFRVIWFEPLVHAVCSFFPFSQFLEETFLNHSILNICVDQSINSKYGLSRSIQFLLKILANETILMVYLDQSCSQCQL